MMKQTLLLVSLLLLFPTVAALAGNDTIIRDRSGSTIATTDRYGNQIIIRDRSGSVVATQDVERRRDRRDRDVPLSPLLGEED